MRIAILAAMVIVALSSNPLIHKEFKANDKSTIQPVTTPASLARARKTLEKLHPRVRCRSSMAPRPQTYEN